MPKKGYEKKGPILQLQLPRKDIVQLIRLRAGHGLINRSRFLVNLTDSPNSEFRKDVLEDMQHKLMDCPLYSEERRQDGNISEQEDLPHVLKSATKNKLKNLLQFMKSAGIRL